MCTIRCFSSNYKHERLGFCAFPVAMILMILLVIAPAMALTDKEKSDVREACGSSQRLCNDACDARKAVELADKTIASPNLRNLACARECSAAADRCLDSVAVVRKPRKGSAAGGVPDNGGVVEPGQKNPGATSPPVLPDAAIER
jgi:hypothetical protein